MGDVKFGRNVTFGRIHLDETRSFQKLDSAAAIGEIRRNRDDVTVFDVGNRFDFVFVVIDAKRSDQGVADRDNLVAVALNVVSQIGFVLEGVEIDFAVRQCAVGRGVVTVFNQFHADFFRG